MRVVLVDTNRPPKLCHTYRICADCEARAVQCQAEIQATFVPAEEFFATLRRQIEERASSGGTE